MNIPLLFGLLILIAILGGGYFLKDTIFNELTKKDLESISKSTVVGSWNKVDLSNQSLTQVPGDIFNNTQIEELDVSGNLLSGSLQAEVRHLQNLRVLNLSGNNFTGVPAEIGQLKNLEILDLSDNQLTGLPNELGNLQNLKVLDISGNDYSELDVAEIQKRLPFTVEIIK